MSARQKAIEAGLTTYNTGKPCRVGHVADRYVSNGECLECVKARNSAHYELNKQRSSSRNRTWKRQNRARCTHRENIRRAALRNATPSWLTQDDLETIELMYSVAGALSAVYGSKFHVDHIIPLQGKSVSGLHVPANLQVIPARDNHKKYNKHDPENRV